MDRLKLAANRICGDLITDLSNQLSKLGEVREALELKGIFSLRWIYKYQNYAMGARSFKLVGRIYLALIAVYTLAFLVLIKRFPSHRLELAVLLVSVGLILAVVFEFYRRVIIKFKQIYFSQQELKEFLELKKNGGTQKAELEEIRMALGEVRLATKSLDRHFTNRGNSSVTQ